MESCRTDACRRLVEESSGRGLTTVWHELGAPNAYWMAVHHYVFTVILIVCFLVIWYQYRQAADELARYQGKS